MALLHFGFLNCAFYFGILDIGLLVICLVSVLHGSYRTIFLGHAPFVRSSKKIVAKILENIRFEPKTKVYELGCGDARFLRLLAKKQDVECVGYEYSLPPFLLAKFFNLFSHQKISVYFRDFLKVNLSEANYIFCFLMPKEMELLEKKFINELKPGTMVISNTFTMKNWQPNKIIDLEKRGFLSNKIYIYYR